MSQDVTLERVTMRFGDFTAVRDISLRIEPGEFFALLGPSGCGKTTILRLISGFNEPSEGKVIVRLGENPMVLRGWSIIDSRGQRVDVSLNGLQTGLPLAASLFKFDGPDAGAIRRGVDRN